MAGNADLGTVRAQVALELKQLAADRAKIRTEFAGIVTDIKASLTQVQKDTEQQMQKTLAGVKQLSTAMLSAGTGIAVALGGAVKSAGDFDQAMRNVNSIALLGQKQFDSLKESVKGIADDPNIRQMPTDLAKGLYDVVSSGFEGAKALEILKVSALGASAGMTDTATSSKVLMAVLNSGISGVTSAKQAMDVLFQEVNLGVNTFGELGNVLGDVLPMAKVAGVSLQEVGAALTVMTRGGINVNEAVTALNQLLTHIVKPSKESTEVMKYFGIEHGIAAVQAKGLTGVLEQMEAKIGANKQAFVALIPEVRGMKALLSLTDESGRKYTEALKGMGEAEDGVGQATKALNEQNKGFNAQLEIAKKELQGVAIEIGEKLLPVLRDAIQYVHGLLKEWKDLTPEVRESYLKIAEWTAGILLVGGAAAKFVGFIATMKTALVSLGVTASATGGLLAAAGFGWLMNKTAKDNIAANQQNMDTNAALGSGASVPIARVRELRQQLGDPNFQRRLAAGNAWALADRDKWEAEIQRLLDVARNLAGVPSKKELPFSVGGAGGFPDFPSAPPKSGGGGGDEPWKKGRGDKTSEWEAPGGTYSALEALMTILKIKKKMWEDFNESQAEEDQRAVKAKQFLTDESIKDALRERDALVASAKDIGKGMQERANSIASSFKGIKDAYDADLQSYGDRDKIMVAYYQHVAEESSKSVEVIKKDNDQIWRNISQGSVSILSNAFFKTMHSGFKNLFGDILTGFADMIERMIAKWLAMQAVMGIAKLFGLPFGGSFLGGLFGFDDAGNDRKAQHWGYDFGKYFTNGMTDYSRHSAAASPSNANAGGSRSASVTTGDIIINVHNAQTMDVNALGKQVAWEMQQRLRVVVGS